MCGVQLLLYVLLSMLLFDLLAFSLLSSEMSLRSANVRPTKIGLLRTSVVSLLDISGYV